MGLIEKEPKAAAIPAKPEYPDWSFDREVCRAGGDGGGARASRAERGAWRSGEKERLARAIGGVLYTYAIRCACE